VLFPWIGIAPPYHFTEGLDGAGDWILPAIIIVSGSFLNARFTRKLPLIITWLSCFAAQALLRHWLLGARIEGALAPMTGVAFILYTFYNVTDPGTTPESARGQALFGASVAFSYGLLMVCHIVFGLFFALSIVCAARGIVMGAQNWLAARERAVEPIAVAAAAAVRE
jgi:Na+-translocating ferredoxin:NAD+ oxidoreductase RnfD subunit